MDNKVDALVQLISCRNLLYNPFLTFPLFLFSLRKETKLFSDKKEIKRIND